MTSTAPLLSDLFDPALLRTAIERGLVREQAHPELPLRILNYTDKAQAEQAWDEATLTCRGLVVDDGGRVAARPFRKFFNHGDPNAGPLDLSAKVTVLDKLDGSLGIAYPVPGGFALATRGSFTSEQARHGTELLRTRHAGFVPPEGVTALFEIVCPGTRNVCDYGETDDLFLLGGVRVADGTVLAPAEIPGWEGPVAASFDLPTLADALAAPPRPGAEGLVVRLTDSGRMLKIKQADYLALHRVLSGLNARVVWERLGAGRTVAGICEGLPDEFHGWVRDLAERLRAEAERIEEGARREHGRILAGLPEGWGRSEYARAAAASPFRQWLFPLLDGRDPRPGIWRSLRPAGDERPVGLPGGDA
ncbi:RNA ligase [Planomonospora corallina]|uniref:RNA ligase n=1 Tax=Planomonospora corallina TaxID=1806052 RepID=A0ABV8I2S0_9ACTN